MPEKLGNAPLLGKFARWASEVERGIFSTTFGKVCSTSSENMLWGTDLEVCFATVEIFSYTTVEDTIISLS